MAEYEDQKKAKKPIDEEVQEFLTGETRKYAEEFISFLRENKMSPQWGAKDSYNLSYKTRRVCIIKFSQGSFELRLNTQYNEEFNDVFQDEPDEVQKFLLDTTISCFGCGTCKPGITMTLLGKPMKGLCYNPVINMLNPDGKWLELAKKLVLLRKKAIAEGKAPKVTYISMKKR